MSNKKCSKCKMDIIGKIKNLLFRKYQENETPKNNCCISTLHTAKILDWYHHVVRITNDNSDFPGWMEYECNISNPLIMQNKLLKDGLLKQCNFEETLHKLTVPQLNEIIHSQNLPNSRKKDDLIDTILTKADRSLISLPVAYTTSEAGIKFVEENEELLAADSFRVYDVKIDEYFDEAKHFPTGYNYLDVVKSILNKRISIYSKQNDFGLLRCVYLFLAEIAEREKDYSNAVKNYIITAYYDTTGLENSNSLSRGDTSIAPAIIKAIAKYKDYFKPEMIKDCKSLYVPRTLTSLRTFESLIKRILDGEPLPEKYI